MGNCQNDDKINLHVISPLPLNSFNGLRIICKSWNKTYSNLYDYTATNEISQKILQLHQSTLLVKQMNTYILKPICENSTLNNNNVEASFEMVQSESIFQFRVSQKNVKNTKCLPWLVVASIPNHRYTIQQGDIVRLGKQKIRIKQIIYNDKYQEKEEGLIQANFKYYNELIKQSKGTNDSDQSVICRICLQEGQQSNPLISPCKCMGSAKYIHFKCIQQWLTKSINPHTINMATIITWKPLICQLCATPLPFKIYIDGKKLFTVNIPRPKKPYLVINPINKDQQNSKVYYLISFAQKNKLLMGRKKDSDIKVSDDASVSRFHTIFQYLNTPKPKFIIEDNNSRYGTLVLLRKNILLKNNLSGLCLQIGGDLLKFEYGKIDAKQNIDQFQQINQSQADSSSQQSISDEEPNQNQNTSNLNNQNSQIMNHKTNNIVVRTNESNRNS